MSVKVSVVVPVFNPGEHIDPLIRSLERQSLPQSEFEMIFVDDGSSDETPEKLDRLAEARENVTVVHIPNSGWPGKPRNIGIETAVGEYVQFVDHDDELGDEALERLYAYATENGSDVVVGKEVRRPGRWHVGPIFDRNRPRATLEKDPILGILTPHKMFRREFLNKHQIRFFEGPRRMEDHPFVVEAFFLADVISVLSDYPVYYWKRRPDRGNAGARPFDWADYYVHMRDVLDVVERHTEPGDFRDRLLSFWYDSKGLTMVSRSVPHRAREDVRRHFEALRDLADERFPPSVDNHLNGVMRVRSKLLRAGDFEAMVALGHLEQGIRLEQQLTDVHAGDGKLTLRLRAGLSYDDGSPVTFELEDGRARWRPPIDLGEHVTEDALDFTSQYQSTQVELAIRNRRTAELVLAEPITKRLPDAPGLVPFLFDMTFEIDPETVVFGNPLEQTVYEMYLRVMSGGWERQSPLRSVLGASVRRPLNGVLRTHRTVVPFTTPGGAVAIDVDQEVIQLLDVAMQSPLAGVLEDHPEWLTVTLPLGQLTFAGRPLRGRLRLVPEAEGEPVGVPLRIRNGGEGKPAIARARITTINHDPANGIAPGRWRLIARLQQHRTDLGLVLDIDTRGGATLSSHQGDTLSQIPARSAIRRKASRLIPRPAR